MGEGLAVDLPARHTFDRKDFRTESEKPPRFNYQDPFTFAARIAQRDKNGGILSIGEDHLEGQGHHLVLVDGKLRLHVTFRYSDLAMRVETRDIVPAGRHIAVTYDGGMRAAGVHMYVDGREWPLHVLFDYNIWPISTSEPLRIGAGGGLRFNGEISDVRIYKRALAGGRDRRARWRFALPERSAHARVHEGARRSSGARSVAREILRDHPHRDGDAGPAATARHLHPPPRRVRRAGRARAAAHAGRAAAVPRRVAEQSPGPGALAGGPRQSTHRACDGESFLADAVRHGTGPHRGGFRVAGRAAVPSRTARLARGGVHGLGLEREGHSQDDGHVGGRIASRPRSTPQLQCATRRIDCSRAALVCVCRPR